MFFKLFYEENQILTEISNYKNHYFKKNELLEKKSQKVMFLEKN